MFFPFLYTGPMTRETIIGKPFMGSQQLCATPIPNRERSPSNGAVSLEPPLCNDREILLR
jgi:hypothetical protein